MFIVIIIKIMENVINFVYSNINTKNKILKCSFLLTSTWLRENNIAHNLISAQNISNLDTFESNQFLCYSDHEIFAAELGNGYKKYCRHCRTLDAPRLRNRWHRHSPRLDRSSGDACPSSTSCSILHFDCEVYRSSQSSHRIA